MRYDDEDYPAPTSIGIGFHSYSSTDSSGSGPYYSVETVKFSGEDIQREFDGWRVIAVLKAEQLSGDSRWLLTLLLEREG